MIKITEIHILELTCDECGKERTWTGESFIDKKSHFSETYFGAKGNRLTATKRDGWSIVRYSCRCPECKGKPRKKKKS